MKPLVILVTSISAYGHTNACAGATRPFLARGHRVVMLLEESYKGTFSPFGFEECIYRKPGPSVLDQHGEFWTKALTEYNILGPASPEEKLRNFSQLYSNKLYQGEFVQFNDAIAAAIDMYKPDLVWVDSLTTPPAVYYSGIHWVRSVSVTPIFFEIDDDLVPGGTGWPSEGDRSQWAAFNEQVRRPLLRSSSLNDLIESIGYERYPDQLKAPGGQCLTVYAYPEELNWLEIRKKSPAWFNLEVFQKPSKIKEEPDLQQLAEVLKKDVPPEEAERVTAFLTDDFGGRFSGKLIYFSMGSIFSNNIELMRRLVEVLGKTKHKYIVCKGPKGEKGEKDKGEGEGEGLTLPSNMYGRRHLPQTSILPHVQLVITHGGNNTVTESFIEGKPMVCLPLFADQFDNAQRLHETGFGIRVDPFSFTDEVLINAVNRLLYNEDLESRLKFAAKRIRMSSRHEELVAKVEEIVEKSKSIRRFFDF